MRPLVLAAVLAALVGCSKPYEGIVFTAMPKAERSTEGSHKESGDPAVITQPDRRRLRAAYQMYTPDADAARGMTMYNADRDDVFPDVASQHWASEALSRVDRTASVFPPTAQPGG